MSAPCVQRPRFAVCVLLVGTLGCLPLNTVRAQSRSTVRPATQRTEDLSGILEPIRKKHGLPALAAAVVRGDRLEALGAVGVRKVGDPTRVSLDDEFHIGSCTKAMTATLLAMLVEQGKLRWDTTIAETFPDLRERIRAEYHDVTLQQLLTHRGGLPEDRKPGLVFLRLRMLQGPMRAQREKLVELALGQKPVARPGKRMVYSNMGYAVAGAMAERVTGRTWEDLMRTMLFEPLGMVTAGFGLPGEPGKVQQPRGHRGVGAQAVPIEPAWWADNPPCLGPAGTVHCSLTDWARFASLHLRGGRGVSTRLKPESFAKLHTPPADSDYAMGWGVVDREWADGRALTHGGSNGHWFALIWIAPEKNVAFLVATNCGPKPAAPACNEVVTALLHHGEWNDSIKTRRSRE